MSHPRRSPGVLLGRSTAHGVVYDLLTETVHHLNPVALALLATLDGAEPIDLLTVQWAEATGAPADVVSRDVAAAIREFTELGLVDRQEAPPPDAPLTGLAQTDEWPEAGAVHAVIDHRVRFHGADADLVATVDRFLAMDTPGGTATIDLAVWEEQDGTVVVRGTGEQRYADRASLLALLPSLLNELAVATRTCVALHAGGVRSPSGRVVLLAGRSGAGKSTLTAALVRAGWDYLGDEAIGIRTDTLHAVPYAKPLALDPSSRAALGLPPGTDPNTSVDELRPGAVGVPGEVGPIAAVVLPVYDATTATALQPLDGTTAIEALLANTLNLRHVGEPGLQTLCDLAAATVVHELAHDGIDEAVRLLGERFG